MTIDDLLTRLGWPTKDLDKKGFMEWQMPHQSPDTLPARAKLTVTPSFISAAVYNVQAADTLEPHYQAAWDITGDEAVVRKLDLGKYKVPIPFDERAIEVFTSLILTFTSPPRIELLGTRVKG
jgi:hypothetical protein